MHATIKTPAEHFGHRDGDFDARHKLPQQPHGAFVVRKIVSRLDEAERAEYEGAYNAAFEAAQARAASWLVPAQYGVL